MPPAVPLPFPHMPTGSDAGNVPRPANPTIASKLGQLQASYPAARGHIRAFRDLGSEYVYAAPAPGNANGGRVVSEEHVHPDGWEDHLIDWVE